MSWPGLDLGGAAPRLQAQEATGDAVLATYDQTVLQSHRGPGDRPGLLPPAAGCRSRPWPSRSPASRRAADLARIRYKEGSIDFLVLLDAERTRLAAEDAPQRRRDRRQHRRRRHLQGAGRLGRMMQKARCG